MVSAKPSHGPRSPPAHSTHAPKPGGPSVTPSGGDRKAEAHGGGGGAGARQLSHQRVLDAVPADPEEAEDDRERYQPARGRRRPCERDRDRAERRAAARDREWRTAPAPERPVGEDAERDAAQHAAGLSEREIAARPRAPRADDVLEGERGGPQPHRLARGEDQRGEGDEPEG